MNGRTGQLGMGAIVFAVLVVVFGIASFAAINAVTAGIFDISDSADTTAELQETATFFFTEATNGIVTLIGANNTGNYSKSFNIEGENIVYETGTATATVFPETTLELTFSDSEGDSVTQSLSNGTTTYDVSSLNGNTVDVFAEFNNSVEEFPFQSDDLQELWTYDLGDGTTLDGTTGVIQGTQMEFGVVNESEFAIGTSGRFSIVDEGINITQQDNTTVNPFPFSQFDIPTDNLVSSDDEFTIAFWHYTGQVVDGSGERPILQLGVINSTTGNTIDGMNIEARDVLIGGGGTTQGYKWSAYSGGSEIACDSISYNGVVPRGTWALHVIKGDANFNTDPIRYNIYNQTGEQISSGNLVSADRFGDDCFGDMSGGKMVLTNFPLTNVQSFPIDEFYVYNTSSVNDVELTTVESNDPQKVHPDPELDSFTIDGIQQSSERNLINAIGVIFLVGVTVMAVRVLGLFGNMRAFGS